MYGIGLGEFYTDMQFAIKILAFLIIVNFVRARVGFGFLSSFLTMFLTYYVLFEQWDLFGPLTIMYLIMLFGIIRIFQDVYFAASGIHEGVVRLKGGHEGMEGTAGPRISAGMMRRS
jgi:hypothetical protein